MSEFIFVSDLKPRSRNINVKFKVVSISEPRNVFSRKDGSEHRVAEAKVADSTGCIILTLWDDNIEKLKEGKTYELKNAYVNLFQNKMRLNIGRNSTLLESEEEIEDLNLDNDLSEKEVRRFNRFERRGTRGRRPY